MKDKKILILAIEGISFAELKKILDERTPPIITYILQEYEGTKSSKGNK